ncbi:hypothetical protein KDL44_01045 [bacterium]|nr:hypothetical protein [bacterium]
MAEITADAMQQFGNALSIYREWENAWLTPVLRSVHEHRFPEARTALAAAVAALPTADLPPEVREACGYLLAYMHCRVDWHPGSRGYTRQDYAAMLERFEPPADSAFAEGVRRMYLAFIRSNGTSDGFDALTRAEIDALLAGLPERLSAPAWQQLARWAYEHGDAEILERAYEIFLEFPGQTMGQAKWQRVALMHGLMRGTATREDVRAYLALLQLRPQLREFRNEFLPRAIDLGLVDADLERELAEKEEEVGMG